MHSTSPLRLIERLRLVAQLWSDASGGSLARLGRLAINDSSYFNRTESPQGTTTATLERFARFLGDPANWPGGAVPDVVRDFVHVVGITPDAAPPSPGKVDAISPADLARREATA